MNSETFAVLVDEAELDALLSGEGAGDIGRHTRLDSKIPNGSTAVLMRRRTQTQAAKPLVLVSRSEDHRRLFGRYATVRDDLSPLSAWCYVVDPALGSKMEMGERRGSLGGFEAAWTGLAIAEALLLSDRSIRQLRLHACLATQTFAVARSMAIWSEWSQKDALLRYDLAQRIMRSNTQAASRVRDYLQPIWTTLAAAAAGEVISRSVETQPLVEALLALERARKMGNDNEAEAFVAPLVPLLPEAQVVGRNRSMSVEERLKVFDHLAHPGRASENGGRHTAASTAANMLAGYLATVAAGGQASLSLAEEANRPEIVAWAYAIGGVGERAVWTSSFDGLGRLVARELLRVFRADEPPSCDFSIEEAQVLADPALTDPLVKLRIKQSRSVSVALLPGVNVMFSLGDQTWNSDVQRAETSKPASSKSRSAEGKNRQGSADILSRLAEELWPHLQPYVRNLLLHGEEKGKSRDRSLKSGEPDERGQKSLIDR